MKPKSYEDMLYMTHHTSAVHPQMSLSDRAAQFSPFAALTGYDAAILETARQTEAKVWLDESQKEEINEKLQMLLREKELRRHVTVTFFRPDEKKDGGAYVTCESAVKKIDTFAQVLWMERGEEIPFESIVELMLEEE